MADRVRAALRRCIDDKSYRERLHSQEKGLIDGRGAHRIAGELMELERDRNEGGPCCRKKKTIKL